MIKAFFVQKFSGNGNQGQGSQGEENQSSESSGDYAKGQLKKHNAFRAKHESPPMTIDDEMSKSAEKYAKHLAATNTFEHSDSKDRNGNGENLWYACNTNNKILLIRTEQATGDW